MKPLDYFFDTPTSGEGHFPQKFCKFIVMLIRIIFKPLFRYKAIDKELFRSMPTGAGNGFLLVGNHRSYLDPVFVMANIRPRTVRYMAKEEFFTFNPIIGRMAAWVGAFPVKRNTADMSALKRAVRMLKRGEIVGIFPEGTRVRSEDQEVKYHDGVAMIANMAKAPVLPFRLWNTEKIQPPGKKFFRCPKMFIRFGTPISVEEERFATLPKEQRYTAFTKAVMDAVYALELPEEYAKHVTSKWM